jgi:hypothetical protein
LNLLFFSIFHIFSLFSFSFIHIVHIISHFKLPFLVVYGDGQSRICSWSSGGSGSEVTWPEVTLVTCTVRKYALCMHNRKLRNIRPNVAGSDKVRWPEEVLSGIGLDRKYVLRMPGLFPRLFFLTRVVVQFLSEVTSDSRHQKSPCLEVCSAHAPFFPAFFFLSSSTPITWLPDVTELWPLRGSLGCAHGKPEVAQHP